MWVNEYWLIFEIKYRFLLLLVTNHDNIPWANGLSFFFYFWNMASKSLIKVSLYRNWKSNPLPQGKKYKSTPYLLQSHVEVKHKKGEMDVTTVMNNHGPCSEVIEETHTNTILIWALLRFLIHIVSSGDYFNVSYWPHGTWVNWCS